MTWYRVTFTGLIVDVAGDRRTPMTDPDRIQGFVDRILEELIKLNAKSPRVEAWAADARVQVEVQVQEESEVVLATLAGFTQIRTAAHAAGLGTPGWQVEWVETSTVSSGDAGKEPVPA